MRFRISRNLSTPHESHNFQTFMKKVA